MRDIIAGFLRFQKEVFPARRELFKSLAGTPDIVHVPYKGSGPSLGDVVAGQVPIVVANITSQVLELHKTGKLRMIVVTANDRLVAAPEIPTAIESGLPGMIAVNFTGLFAPRGTPKPIIEQIAGATDTVMEDDNFRTTLIESGLEPYRHSTPDKTRQFVEQDIARWTPVFRSIGMKLN